MRLTRPWMLRRRRDSSNTEGSRVWRTVIGILMKTYLQLTPRFGDSKVTRMLRRIQCRRRLMKVCPSMEHISGLSLSWKNKTGISMQWTKLWFSLLCSLMSASSLSCISRCKGTTRIRRSSNQSRNWRSIVDSGDSLLNLFTALNQVQDKEINWSSWDS